MAKSMVIVESPAKSRTIKKYLGDDFFVRACAGHIKDLPSNGLGVDLENSFAPTYGLIPGKEKIVSELKKLAKKTDTIYLAADPDREGEAICQHLAEELNGSKSRKVYRVLFNEITKPAILAAFENPGLIDRDKVEAQQARRILDRLVGYQVSPLLWKKVRRGLSAGRVQSVALRLVVEREKEIRGFDSEEYWNFSSRLRASSPPPFIAKGVKLDGKKFRVSNKDDADALMALLKNAVFVVSDVRKKERKKSPVPPFITSTLQQDASRKLGFSVKKTMVVAQRLYEGVDIGDQGLVGLITYMRTDSTRVSDLAVQDARDFVADKFGEIYLPAKAPAYRKKKGAQDAHEAIRPTSARLTPQKIKTFLDRDENRLYELIWKRFLASQMAPAAYDQTEIDVTAANVLFRTVGTIMKFDGFLRIYREGRDESGKLETEGEDNILPEVTPGEKLRVEKLENEQKFTQPPPRYSEASLVKALEERGIGRPSTYAQMITVIQSREYVRKEEKRFVPTETGEVVTELLIESFPELFDYGYTAKMEQNLDDIESGRMNWVKALDAFYSGFSRELEKATTEMKDLKKEEIPTGIECEKCGKGEMFIRWGRFGRFMACSNYPECKNTREVVKEDGSSSAAAELEGETCEKCGRSMVLKKGRYGEFLACSGYPECKNTKRTVEVSGQVQVKEDKPLDEACPKCQSNLVIKTGRFGEFTACSNYPECRYIRQESTGVSCPDCGKGDVVQKKSRRGKVFYGCNEYPKCKFVLWNKPVPAKCPECQAPFLEEKSTKKQGLIRFCHNKDCGYKTSLEEAVSA